MMPAASHPQDIRHFLADYRARHPDDVLTFEDEVSADQDITAMIWQLAAEGRAPMLVFERVAGLRAPVVTNMFGSRERIARMLGAAPASLHEAYQACSRKAVAPRVVASGPVLGEVEEKSIDLTTLPMLRHFETDRASYVTNGIIVAENPDGGGGNLSYHRAMVHSKTELATSLHSRGHLWRLLNMATLARLPVSEVKLDKSFVMGMKGDTTDALIVRSTIDLAHKLGLSVTAEGVEDEETLKGLCALGCDVVQGFLLSPPLEASELAAWMRGSAWTRAVREAKGLRRIV